MGYSTMPTCIRAVYVQFTVVPDIWRRIQTFSS